MFSGQQVTYCHPFLCQHVVGKVGSYAPVALNNISSFPSLWWGMQAPSRPQELTSQGRKLEAAIQAGAMAVLNLQDSLNDWDSKVGDGDCGTTVSAAAMN
jgi:hypothetical protein